MAVWPQTERKDYLRNLNLEVAPRSVLCHYKHFERVEERVEECAYQGVLPSSRLNKAVCWQIYKKYNWQRVSDELAICTACKIGCRAEPSALQHVLYLTRCGHSQNNIGGS